MLSKSRLSLILIARISKIKLSASAETTSNLGASHTLLALNAYHLRLLDNADFFTGGKMHKSANTVGKSAVGVRNSSWIIGDEKAELKFWVIVEDVEVFQAYGSCVVVGCFSLEPDSCTSITVSPHR